MLNTCKMPASLVRNLDCEATEKENDNQCNLYRGLLTPPTVQCNRALQTATNAARLSPEGYRARSTDWPGCSLRLHLVVCAINGSPTFICILPPLFFFDTNNNLVHDNLSQKKKISGMHWACTGICVHRYSYFQDMCPYRLPISTPPTPLRKLSKGPTVPAHPVENPPGSGARKAQKCQKKPEKNVARCFFCALCIYMPFRAPQCTLQLISCEIGKIM